MSQIIHGRRITVAEMAPHIHSFLPNENKVNKISAWLKNWIVKSLKSGIIKPYDFMPSKGELAFHIGVSLGTMQNVFRIVEDTGLIASRQKIGTYINDLKDNKFVDKLTSKREVSVEIIKDYILSNNYKVGDRLISIRKLSDLLKIPFATVRMAVSILLSNDILEQKEKSLQIKSLSFEIISKEQQTLVDKVADSINQYIKENLKYGDKLPSNNTLSDMFGVSIKTVHDAIKILKIAGILKTKRGYYGTVVSNPKDDDIKDMYYYEQVEQAIKKYIAENCKVGAKLPSIKEFADVFNVSAKTIKNALDNLAIDGYINFVRGRLGGTFVIALPEIYERGYAWLALSPEFEQKN